MHLKKDNVCKNTLKIIKQFTNIGYYGSKSQSKFFAMLISFPKNDYSYITCD